MTKKNQILTIRIIRTTVTMGRREIMRKKIKRRYNNKRRRRRRILITTLMMNLLKHILMS
jgi:hypothetical protein